MPVHRLLRESAAGVGLETAICLAGALFQYPFPFAKLIEKLAHSFGLKSREIGSLLWIYFTKRMRLIEYEIQLAESIE